MLRPIDFKHLQQARQGIQRTGSGRLRKSLIVERLLRTGLGEYELGFDNDRIGRPWDQRDMAEIPAQAMLAD